MPIQIATAPCCWGVDDIFNPNLPDWKMVFHEAAVAGYGGIELGPYGYVPLDTLLVAPELMEHNLSIVAGTIFEDLVDPAARSGLLERVNKICTLLTELRALGNRNNTIWTSFPLYLTVMDWGHDERDFTAGHPERAKRLSDASWRGMIDNIRAVSQLARDKFGVRAVIHPHAGGYIEFDDEIGKVCADVPHDEAGLCLDTGHAYYAGLDPAAMIRQYRDRLDYLHFKDIDEVIFRKTLNRKIRFFESCSEGVMCPIGRGALDYVAIHQALEDIGYVGIATIEQERDPRLSRESLEDVKASLQFLKNSGF